MNFDLIRSKARDLFQSAPFFYEIQTESDYLEALALLDELMVDYENQRPLIELLSTRIEQWENTASEFTAFNQACTQADPAIDLLKTLMEQHQLDMSQLPEIGSKSLVSRILKGERSLTRKHIEQLSQRFQISPALFFASSKPVTNAAH
ncbi:helix-turn-helix domain-containing protein [Marinospirillum alkaliphilum]|uniref:HTH-type transcriptional regulator / antitoxin HigA n=1 Tax=Marinospirillum alkaliphilum DSM 21637 TaxID=1122209 RepID=A0A1K1V8W3_9GAMM|nr:transcriptional regulator [Marinospirillum alkaliphilum]SFX21196.1 HTH-type transcriptional regulator / antitoxin HigA [Marinospirillum alkaliphilum DSM 21637]